eukprot:s22_g48.t1
MAAINSGRKVAPSATAASFFRAALLLGQTKTRSKGGGVNLGKRSNEGFQGKLSESQNRESSTSWLGADGARYSG